MNAACRLLVLVLSRMWVASALVIALFLGGLVMMVWLHAPQLILAAAAAGWLWHMMAGMTLRDLLRPETLLLPDFRRHLALAGAIDVALAIVLPIGLMLALGGTDHVLLATAGMLLALAFGLATGTGLRVTLLFWLAFIVAGWKPGLSAMVARAALASSWTPWLLALFAALLLRLTLRPLFVIADRRHDESPLDAMADGRKPVQAADGAPRRRGWIHRQLNRLADFTAQRAMHAALARFRRRPSALARLNLIRSVLLPHDNAAAVGLRLLLMAAIGTAYFLATHAGQRWQAGYVGGYAVILGIGRFNAIGQGMLRMRPNLADLYMTLAPSTRAEFQATLADVMQWLIVVAVFSSVAYAGLVVLLLHVGNPAQLLLAAGISSVAASLCALAAQLIGPESTFGRVVVQLLVLAGAVGTYALSYWLLGLFGLGWGSAAALALTLPFGIGTWLAARREYLGRPPCFDVPLV
jgi:hypothetical protein